MKTSLSDCLEEIYENMKHKNPQVKLETCRWLIRCLRETKVPPSKAESKAIAECATKLLGDTSEPVRTSSAEVMGTLMKILGERQMNPYMDGLDDIRKAKIKEFFDSAVVKAKDKPPPPPPPPAAKAPAKKVLGKKPAGAAGKAPAPAAKKEEAPAPSLPKPGSKLAAPKAAPGGLKLKKPAGSAPAAAPPPPTLPSPTEPEPPVASKLQFGGRGLTSRPLQSAPAPVQQAPPPVYVDPGLTAAEKAELEELRRERERLVKQANEQTSERIKLMHEINNLQLQVCDSHVMCSLLFADFARMPNLLRTIPAII